MANNFTSIQENQASKKFALVRIKPARYLNDDLVNTSGTEYEAPFPFMPVSVAQNGVALSESASLPISNGEYHYANGTLTLKTTTAPSSTSAIVASYYIFLTGERFRVLGEDPETPTVELRDWEPKIIRSPRVSYDISNTIQGVLSISGSSIQLINDNDDFNKYLGDNDSFYKKEIEIWQCLDSTDNIKKLFFGVINQISIDRTTVSIDYQDDNSKLSLPALMGDDLDTAYFSKSGFANVEPNRQDSPIYYFFGRVSRYQLENDNSVASYPTAQQVQPESLYPAVCTSFSSTISTTTNREWGIARTSANGFEDFSFSPSVVDHAAANHSVLTGTSAEIDKFFIGDTFATDNGPEYGRVLFVDRLNDQIYTTKVGSLTTSDNVLGNDCPTIVITDINSNRYFPLYGRDYTATESTLSSGNKYVKITFVNNFESNVSLPTSLDPGQYTVGFRVHPLNSTQKQATVLKEILDKAGITTKAASFTAANTALDVNANFSIPYFDESDFSDYTKYVEGILGSTLGYIYLDNNFEMNYELLATPTSTDAVTDTDILEDTYNVEIDYQDIVTQIIAFNPHHSSSEVNSESSATASSIKAQYLHDIIRVTRFRHVLEDFSSKITDHINLKSNRLAIYSYITKQLNYLSEIGDDALLSKTGIPGQNATRALKILGIDKEIDQTRILATDLLDI